MSYPTLALLGIGLSLAAGALLLLRRDRSAGRPTHLLLAVAITIVALLALTAIFDNIMIGLDLFYYAPEGLSGVLIGLAPIEDFSYPIAGALLLPALWLATARPSTARRQAFRQFIIASRPISWINTAFPFGAAYLVTTRDIDWIFVVGVLYFLIPYNLAMYGINDVFDYDSDVANPRKGGIEGALLRPALHKPMLITVGITNIPLLLVLFLAGNWTAWLALLVSVFALLAYSVPGFRFKERPFIDSMTSATHFVSPAVVGFMMAEAQIGWPAVILLSAFLIWGMAAHAFGAIQDIIPDRQASIHSVATAIGARATARMSLTLWAIAGLLMLATPYPGPLAAFLAVPYIVNCGPYWNVTDETSSSTNTAWRRFIWLNYIAGFLATMILILHWKVT